MYAAPATAALPVLVTATPCCRYRNQRPRLPSPSGTPMVACDPAVPVNGLYPYVLALVPPPHPKERVPTRKGSPFASKMAAAPPVGGGRKSARSPPVRGCPPAAREPSVPSASPDGR